MKTLKQIAKQKDERGAQAREMIRLQEQDKYAWEQINQALMNKGYSPARIASILVELTHITKK